ncbi:unnamed protein product, partial [Ectocarpus sp. 12 AP-2014]
TPSRDAIARHRRGLVFGPAAELLKRVLPGGLLLHDSSAGSRYYFLVVVACRRLKIAGKMRGSRLCDDHKCGSHRVLSGTFLCLQRGVGPPEGDAF